MKLEILEKEMKIIGWNIKIKIKRYEIGKIIRDKKFSNTIWYFIKNYNEFLQFSKDLFLFKGLTNEFHNIFNEEERWINNSFEWENIFDIQRTNDNIDLEEIDPINDTYEIEDKPDEDEYPIIIYYDNYAKNILWISLNKLINTNTDGNK